MIRIQGYKLGLLGSWFLVLASRLVLVLFETRHSAEYCF